MRPIIKIFIILFTIITFKIFELNSFFFEKNIYQNSDYKFHFSPYSQITEYDLSGKNNTIVEISKLTNISSYIFAFIQDSGNCHPAWDGDKNNLIQNELILNYFKNISNNNIQFKISLGGADGYDLSLGCKSTNDLFDSYENIIKLYHPIGLDFDLEGKFLNNKTAINKILNALVLLQQNDKRTKITFTLPFMPEGVSKRVKYFINKAKLKKISFNINLLAMDYSPELNENMFFYTAQATLNVFQFLKGLYTKKSEKELWCMIEITTMIGINDIKSEFFTLNDAKKLVHFSIDNQIGGIHFWSLERDKPCKLGKLSKICSGIPEQKNYEFMEIFNNKMVLLDNLWFLPRCYGLRHTAIF